MPMVLRPTFWLLHQKWFQLSNKNKLFATPSHPYGEGVFFLLDAFVDDGGTLTNTNTHGS